MLDEITAENLGLIASAEVQLDPGLTVVTGETGTGKTLLLGALRLLRGDKASKGVIGPHADICDVSARFVDDDHEQVVRRRVDATRSRAYLDGAAASARELGDVLADHVAIIGQHDQLAITSSKGVRSLVDRQLDDAGTAALVTYRDAWAVWTDVLAQLGELGDDPRVIERERDIAAHQVQEIDDAEIEPDVDATLRQRVVAMRNADALIADLDRALVALGDDGAGGMLDRATVSLRNAAAVDPEGDALVARLEDLSTDLSEIARDLVTHASAVEADPAALADLEDRLALLGSLTRKYGDTLEDVLAFRKDAAATLERLSELLDAATDIEDRRAAAHRALVDAGAELRIARQAAADGIAARAIAHLRDLGFTAPRLSIAVEASEPSSTGADTVIVRFASDEGLDPGPVSAIASGGELSRLVLALTLAAGFADASTLAFDEIDTGIGGTTALAMGQKLHQLSRDRQVVCVTHLPQVAAFADRHLVVDRDGTTASIRSLDDDDRVTELTRMLSGLSESVPGLDHARELLDHVRGG